MIKIFFKKTNTNKWIFILFFFILSVFPFLTDASGVIPCETKENQRVCTLCDLVVGVHNVIEWGFRVAVVVGVFSIVIAGVLYVVSAGNPKMTGMAKDAMWNVFIGIVVLLSAWLMVNYTMILLGVNEDLASHWWDFNFTCN